MKKSKVWKKLVRPTWDTGLGLHDSANAWENPPDIEQHAMSLLAAGITWYKILAAGMSKVDRVKIYKERGIEPVVRLWEHKPFPNQRVDHGLISVYRQAGATYFEIGNEPNLKEEWEDGKWTTVMFGRLVADFFLANARVVLAEGGIPVTPAMSPGGHYFHRDAFNAFLDGIRSVPDGKEIMSNSVLGLHPRPLNNPPDTPATALNNTTFNEWKWYVEAVRNVFGFDMPIIATEHGYSPGSSENAEFPPIDDEKWARYNKELFERFDPKHPATLGEHWLAAMYWLEKSKGSQWYGDSPFWDGDWIGTSVREQDRAWGKALWEIQPKWNRNVMSTPFPVDTFTSYLLEMGETHHVMPLNPQASLQKRIFADGYVPTSPEFSVVWEGVEFVAQRAEHLTDGSVRVYYVQKNDWENVKYVQK